MFKKISITLILIALCISILIIFDKKQVSANGGDAFAPPPFIRTSVDDIIDGDKNICKYTSEIYSFTRLVFSFVEYGMQHPNNGWYAEGGSKIQIPMILKDSRDKWLVSGSSKWQGYLVPEQSFKSEVIPINLFGTATQEEGGGEAHLNRKKLTNIKIDKAKTHLYLDDSQINDYLGMLNMILWSITGMTGEELSSLRDYIQNENKAYIINFEPETKTSTDWGGYTVDLWIDEDKQIIYRQDVVHGLDINNIKSGEYGLGGNISVFSASSGWPADTGVNPPGALKSSNLNIWGFPSYINQNGKTNSGLPGIPNTFRTDFSDDTNLRNRYCNSVQYQGIECTQGKTCTRLQPNTGYYGTKCDVRHRGYALPLLIVVTYEAPCDIVEFDCDEEELEEGEICELPEINYELSGISCLYNNPEAINQGYKQAQQECPEGSSTCWMYLACSVVADINSNFSFPEQPPTIAAGQALRFEVIGYLKSVITMKTYKPKYVSCGEKCSCYCNVSNAYAQCKTRYNSIAGADKLTFPEVTSTITDEGMDGNFTIPKDFLKTETVILNNVNYVTTMPSEQTWISTAVKTANYRFKQGEYITKVNGNIRVSEAILTDNLTNYYYEKDSLGNPIPWVYYTNLYGQIGLRQISIKFLNRYGILGFENKYSFNLPISNPFMCYFNVQNEMLVTEKNCIEDVCCVDVATCTDLNGGKINNGLGGIGRRGSKTPPGLQYFVRPIMLENMFPCSDKSDPRFGKEGCLGDRIIGTNWNSKSTLIETMQRGGNSLIYNEVPTIYYHLSLTRENMITLRDYNREQMQGDYLSLENFRAPGTSFIDLEKDNTSYDRNNFVNTYNFITRNNLFDKKIKRYFDDASYSR